MVWLKIEDLYALKQYSQFFYFFISTLESECSWAMGLVRKPLEPTGVTAQVLPTRGQNFSEGDGKRSDLKCEKIEENFIS